MLKKIILLLVGALGAYTAWYVYTEFTRKPATANELTTDFVFSSDALLNEFLNEERANKKLINKVIEVYGLINEVAKNENVYTITLLTENPMSGISVQLIETENAKAEKLKSGSKVNLKGICNGKLSDVELNKGIILQVNHE